MSKCKTETCDNLIPAPPGNMCDECTIGILQADNVKLMGDIVSYEQQVSRLEAQLSKSPWISVEDGLPESEISEDFFLVLFEGEPEVCFYDGQWDSPNLGFLPSAEVTHWMEAPELPKNNKPLEKEAELEACSLLPDCKFQFQDIDDNYVSCRRTEQGPNGLVYGELYGKPCSKRCVNPVPKEADNE